MTPRAMVCGRFFGVIVGFGWLESGQFMSTCVSLSSTQSSYIQSVRMSLSVLSHLPNVAFGLRDGLRGLALDVGHEQPVIVVVMVVDIT